MFSKGLEFWWGSGRKAAEDDPGFIGNTSFVFHSSLWELLPARLPGRDTWQTHTGRVFRRLHEPPRAPVSLPSGPVGGLGSAGTKGAGGRWKARPGFQSCFRRQLLAGPPSLICKRRDLLVWLLQRRDEGVDARCLWGAALSTGAIINPLVLAGLRNGTSFLAVSSQSFLFSLSLSHMHTLSKGLKTDSLGIAVICCRLHTSLSVISLPPSSFLLCLFLLI